MARKRIVYDVPEMRHVTVARNCVFGSSAAGNPLTMDVYRPPGKTGESILPAVVFVAGYADPGFTRVVGCPFKEMAAYISWSELIAASGMIAITYTNEQPAEDLSRLLQHLAEEAESLGIDATRTGLWACSGNVPTAIGNLVQDHLLPTDSSRTTVACAALCYGYTLDLDDDTAVVDAASMFGFEVPMAEIAAADLSISTPLLVVRAAEDEMPGINQSIDRFCDVLSATSTADMTRLDLPDACHAFDLEQDTDASREAIQTIVEFLKTRLRA